VRLPQVPTEEARRIIDIDLMGVFYAMKHQLPQMERQHREARKGGAIVNIASVAGLFGAPRLSVYSAAKHGVVGLTRSVAAEYATKGIRVNAVCPGWVRTRAALRSLTEISATAGVGEEDMLGQILAGQALPGLMEPDDVADVYLFLASDRARKFTGQAVNVDRGEVMA
jgi:NAD(P)-dependent dehydrogenase (short-subunit alcohol dehydrogenase family)